MISVLSSSQWSYFFKHDTIFSVARSISDMSCHSSESSSQFHVEIWCYHHVHLYKYIYYCYAKQLDVLWQMFHVKYSSGYTYNWVHFWFLQFPKKKIVIPCNMYVFLILPFMFLWYLTYINLLLSTFFHIIFLLCHTLYKLLILSFQKPYSSSPLIYVMKWVNMTYVLLHRVCFWQFAHLVTINFQEFSINYLIMKVVCNHLFANSLKITFLCGTDRCFHYYII